MASTGSGLRNLKCSFHQLGEKLELGALGGPRIRIERYQPVHLLKVAAVLLFRLDDANIHDR